MSYTVYHKVCGLPCFLYDHTPVAGEVLKKKHAKYLDGRRIEESDTFVSCGSCGAKMMDVRALMPRPVKLKTYDMMKDSDMEHLYG